MVPRRRSFVPPREPLETLTCVLAGIFNFSMAPKFVRRPALSTSGPARTSCLSPLTSPPPPSPQTRPPTYPPHPHPHPKTKILDGAKQHVVCLVQREEARRAGPAPVLQRSSGAPHHRSSRSTEPLACPLWCFKNITSKTIHSFLASSWSRAFPLPVL